MSGDEIAMRRNNWHPFLAISITFNIMQCRIIHVP